MSSPNKQTRNLCIRSTFSVLIFLSLMLLAGCTSAPVLPPEPTVAPPKESIDINENLLKECPPLKRAEEGRTYTELQLVEELMLPWINTYDSCKDNNSALIRLIKNAFNINTESDSAAGTSSN